jgi:hypothetical protein
LKTFYDFSAVNIHTDDIHEITDDEGDTLFSYVDVVWASFYELPDEPDYLYTAIQMAELKDRIGCVYAVHWRYDRVLYDTGFHNGILIPYQDYDRWTCHYFNGNAWIDTWNESYNNGLFDTETSIITWRIHKDCIGDPQPGDMLTHAHVFAAQRISYFALIPYGNLFRSFSDSTNPAESIAYTIQY